MTELVQQPKAVHSFETDEKSYTMVQATEADVPEVAQFENDFFDVGEPYSLADYETIYEIGDIFMIKDETGKTVGITSLSYGPKSHSKLTLGEDEGYYKGSVLHPDARGKGMSVEFNKLREAVAREKGMKAVYTCVREDNVPSVRALTKAGFVVVDRKENFMPVDERSGDNGSRLIMKKDLQPVETQAEATEELPAGISLADMAVVGGMIENRGIDLGQGPNLEGHTRIPQQEIDKLTAKGVSVEE